MAHSTNMHVQPARQSYSKVGLLCLGLVLAAGIAALYLWRSPTIRVLSVQSGSMMPLIHKGDAVIIEPVKTNNLSMVQVGDIISYHSPADQKVVITHRVQSLDAQNRQIVTKGDNNLEPDQPFAANQVVGRVTQHIPWLGQVIDLLHSPVGLAITIYIPALIAVGFELRRLTGYFKPTYRSIGYVMK